jgi:glycosyltransferase involved in cell wall biosynthesis
MLFSILIAHYNNSVFLDECINSVYAQTYTNWEIVLIDDESSDMFEQIIQKYTNHPHIRIYRNGTNKGCAFTKHKLASLAKGEIMAFLDPDDTLHPEALQVMVDAHIKNPECSIINSTHFVCDANLAVQKISEKPRPLPQNTPYLLLSDGSIHAFASFKKKKYDQTDGVTPVRKMDKAVDQDFYYVLEEVGDVLYINKPLYYYRIHKGSISNEGQEAAAMISHNHLIEQACRRRIANLKKTPGPESNTWIRKYRTRLYKVRILNSFRERRWLMFIQSLLVYPFAGGMENIISYLKKIPKEGFVIFRRSFIETYKH